MAFFSDNDPDLMTLLWVLAVSTLSGFISISQRIARGAAVNTLWLVSEFAAAILCGYLMWDAFPHVTHLLPDWFTLPIAVAVASHFGGRGWQSLEKNMVKHFDFTNLDKVTKRKPPSE